MNLHEQHMIMNKYAQMMFDRGDWHGLWDAAIDLQRLEDKLIHPNSRELKKNCNDCDYKDEQIEIFKKEATYYYEQMRKYEIEKEEKFKCAHNFILILKSNENKAVECAKCGDSYSLSCDLGSIPSVPAN